MDVPSRIDSGDRGQDDADEAQRGFFGLIGSRIGKQRGEAAASLHTHDALLLLRNYEESGQGWFWSTDAKGRSEEHTSELQSLMRISYAVFCLKKKKDKKQCARKKG